MGVGNGASVRRPAVLDAGRHRGSDRLHRNSLKAENGDAG